jgi:threonine/homoserine/homoserine lactone efflux protein
MHALFPSMPALVAFLAASLVLAVTPGPGVFYIVTRSATQGRAAGLASVAGVALGNLGNATAASLGLAALFAMSSMAFLVVKCLGAVYLIHLGIRAMRAPGSGHALDGAVGLAPMALRRIFTDGFIVALFNPKTAIFLAAFLPQFLPATAQAGPTIALGGIFVLIAAATDTCYAIASGAVGPWLTRGSAARQLGRYVSGAAFIGLGLLAAFTGQRAKT